MPIPRCEKYVGLSCGGYRQKWLMDAIEGYNQIFVAKSYWEKISFARPNCTKYTYSLVLSIPPSYLSFSYMTWTQHGRALLQRYALSLIPKLTLGSSFMTSTAGVDLLRSLLIILNANWMSAYLKISHFLWKIPLLSIKNGIFRSWSVHQRQLRISIEELPDEDVATILSGLGCGVVFWVT